MDNYKKEFTDLINNHFDEIKDYKIVLKPHNESDCFAYTINLIFYRAVYYSAKDFKKLTSNQRKGVLAHELAHIIRDKRKGVFRRIFNKYDETEEERIVDMIVIEKGCGLYLLELIKHHDKHYKKYTKKDGLTKNEILDLLNT